MKLNKRPKKSKSPEDKEITRRQDFEQNADRIRDAVISHMKEHKKPASMSDISKKLGLSYKTVWRHMKQIKFNSEAHPLRALSSDILVSIYNASLKGNPSSQKLWFQLMEGWSEKTNFEITTDGKALPRELDLSKLTTEDLEDYQRIQSKITGEGMGD